MAHYEKASSFSFHQVASNNWSVLLSPSLNWIFFFNLFSKRSCSDGKNCWMHLVCICSKRWITKSDYKVERVNKRSILSMGKETDFFLYQLQRKLLGNEKHQRIAFDFKGFKCNLEGLQQYTAMQHQYILDLSSWSRDAKQKLKLFLELFWDLSS